MDTSRQPGCDSRTPVPWRWPWNTLLVPRLCRDGRNRSLLCMKRGRFWPVTLRYPFPGRMDLATASGDPYRALYCILGSALIKNARLFRSSRGHAQHKRSGLAGKVTERYKNQPSSIERPDVLIRHQLSTTFYSPRPSEFFLTAKLSPTASPGQIGGNGGNGEQGSLRHGLRRFPSLRHGSVQWIVAFLHTECKGH